MGITTFFLLFFITAILLIGTTTTLVLLKNWFRDGAELSKLLETQVHQSLLKHEIKDYKVHD